MHSLSLKSFSFVSSLLSSRSVLPCSSVRLLGHRLLGRAHAAQDLLQLRLHCASKGGCGFSLQTVGSQLTLCEVVRGNRNKERDVEIQVHEKRIYKKKSCMCIYIYICMYIYIKMLYIDVYASKKRGERKSTASKEKPSKTEHIHVQPDMLKKASPAPPSAFSAFPTLSYFFLCKRECEREREREGKNAPGALHTTAAPLLSAGLFPQRPPRLGAAPASGRPVNTVSTRVRQQMSQTASALPPRYPAACASALQPEPPSSALALAPRANL